MKLTALEQHWNALGQDDPLWAILSEPDKRGGAWELDEFLATGRREIAALLDELRARGLAIGGERALDFGCGIGRLTQALADHFERCDGVDLAPSMIEHAVALNQRGERCRFHHNAASDLRLFADRSFDFVLSLLVFQHMEPALMKAYLREVVRVLRPDGIAYFNVPDSFVLGVDLPPEAIRAAVESHWTPRPLAAGEIAQVSLRVRNVSDVLWPVSARLLVGNHWLAADGEMLVHDDGRAAIDAAVPPGGEYELELAVTAPDVAGSYQLEFDLLQEQRWWFSAKGSPTLRVPVAVQPSDRPAAPGLSAGPEPRQRDVLVPRIEMHVMPREETVSVIEAAGGVVLDVIAKDRCGAAAPSFDYVVGRAPQPTARLEAAGAVLGANADLLSFPVTSRRRLLGPASVLVRAALRRGLLDVLHRQSQFNVSSSRAVQELEMQIEQLQKRVEVQDVHLNLANERIRSLEARLGMTSSEPPQR